ncbi:MAG: PEP-CTERM sorting domain-containing protein [Planctomycetota bacterium]
MSMKKLITIYCVVVAVMATTTVNASAVNFTGGTATLSDGTTVVPNNTVSWSNVDYYVEDGFKFDFIGGDGTLGTWNGWNNDDLHGHWATGSYGSLTSILVTKLDETPFDLTSFVLVTNTDMGGGAASGNEQTWINSSNGFSQLLPPEDWGYGAGSDPTIILGPEFSNITWVSFTVSNRVDCFGMDNFVPEPATICLLGLGALGILKKRRA